MVFLLSLWVDLFYHSKCVCTAECHVALLVQGDDCVLTLSCCRLTACEACVIPERNAGWVDVVGAIAIHSVSPWCLLVAKLASLAECAFIAHVLAVLALMCSVAPLSELGFAGVAVKRIAVNGCVAALQRYSNAAKTSGDVLNNSVVAYHGVSPT